MGTIFNTLIKRWEFLKSVLFNKRDSHTVCLLKIEITRATELQYLRLGDGGTELLVLG